MFGFKLWSRFASFKDPITITQNMTLSIPPKTTIGGMLAAVLGIDYNDYFGDSHFFDFHYSLILLNPARKRSYSQNYVMDYTKKSGARMSFLSSIGNKTLDDWKKNMMNFRQPKPIYREVLHNPCFLIFIENFKYENEIKKLMESHESAFPLYMGNTEFAANYQIVPLKDVHPGSLVELDSFTAQTGKINFEAGKKYSNVYAASRVSGKREYSEYKNIVICDHKLKLTSEVAGYKINTSLGSFNCEFI